MATIEKSPGSEGILTVSPSPAALIPRAAASATG